MMGLEILIGVGILLGIAMLTHCFFKYRGTEGLIVSLVLTVAIMYVGVRMQCFWMAYYFLCGLAALGVLLSLLFLLLKKKNVWKTLIHPSYLIFYIMILIGAGTLQGVEFASVDDINIWAKSVEDVINYNLLPTAGHAYGYAILGAVFNPTGRIEALPYYFTSFVLLAIGMSLPAAGLMKLSKQKLFLYILTVYVGTYSFYSFGIKTLNPGLYIGVLCVGTAFWWMEQKTGVMESLIVIMVGVLIFLLKPWSGFVFSLWLFYYCLVYAYYRNINNKRKAFIAYSLLGGGVLSLSIFLFLYKKVWTDIVRQMFMVAISVPLSENSNHEYAALPVIVATYILVYFISGIYLKKDRAVFLLLNSLFLIIWFWEFYAYRYSLQEVVNETGFSMELSEISMLFFALGVMFICFSPDVDAKHGDLNRLIPVVLAICLVFSTNKAYIAATTAWNSEKEVYSEERAIAKVAALCSFLINQEGETPKYYVIDQSGEDYIRSWLDFFYSYGDVDGIVDGDEYSEEALVLAMLPSILKEVKYEYVLIGETNSYLKKNLSKVVTIDTLSEYTMYSVKYHYDGTIELKAL